MKKLDLLALSLLSIITFGGLSAAGAQTPKPGVVKAPPSHAARSLPFEEAAYLWTQGTDKNNFGDGDWGMYKAWLNTPKLGAETDPGGWSDWGSTTEGYDNQNWGNQQTHYGTEVLPDILLGIGSMPYDTTASDSWNQKMAWESNTWALEAANDPATMQHFLNLADNIAKWNYKSVIIRMDYEFDGGWDPYGNLNVMAGMPGNFIKAWQNVVTTIRTEVAAKNTDINVKFLWNPTDANVQISSASYYPGDAFVDYIGFDSYDADYTGIYKPGVQPDAATQQLAWTNSISKRMQWFADFASAANPGSRNGYIKGRSVPLIAGEWGLWQVDPNGRGAGGDDPSYIQNMFDWMTTHNVYMESYFETPSDGRSTLWPGGYPAVGSGNPSWGSSGSPYPKAAALYRKLFGQPIPPVVPTTPAGLTAAPGFKSAALAWQPSRGEPLPTYTLTRSTEAGGRASKTIASGLSGTSYADPNLTDGVTYFYTVKAVNSAGASAPSGAVSVTPAVPANFVQNAGFEAGDLSPWQIAAGSTPGASYLENADNRIHVHSGSRQYTHWANSLYEATLLQPIVLTNGPHTVSAWIKSSGAQVLCQMEITVNGVKTLVSIPASPDWTQISKTVIVSGGTLTVGFHSKATAGQWLNVDDVSVK